MDIDRQYCPNCGQPDVVVSLASTLLEIRPEVRNHSCRVGFSGELPEE
jgi:hypothetical protein